MKTLAWVLVILNQSEIITDGELLYPSLQKCEMYEKKVNRPLQKIQRYTYSAYCRPEVVDRIEELWVYGTGEKVKNNLKSVQS